MAVGDPIVLISAYKAGRVAVGGYGLIVSYVIFFSAFQRKQLVAWNRLCKKRTLTNSQEAWNFCVRSACTACERNCLDHTERRHVSWLFSLL